MALLGIAGLFTGVPVLRSVPDALDLVADGGLWDSIGPLVLVQLVELALLAVACFVLAWLVSQGDPVGRAIAVVVGASLAFGVLVGDVLDGTSATITVVASVGGLLFLTLPPRVRAFFAARRPPGDVPSSVVAAEAIVVMLMGLVLAVGIACLPVTPVKAKFGVVGLALIGISIAGIKQRRRLPTADPAARTLASGLMAGVVLAIVLGREGALTGPLLVLLGVAVSVVVLLWLPHDSQAFYGNRPAADDVADEDGRDMVELPSARPRQANRSLWAERTEAPPPDDATSPRPAARSVRVRRADASPSDAAAPPQRPPSRSPAPSPPPPPPPPPTPRSRPRPGPIGASGWADDDPSPRRSASAPTSPPPAAALAPSTPPVWLLDAPPPGFWPPERPRAQPRQYEMVDVGPPSADGHLVAPGVGLRFDTTSWFPALDRREQVRGAYLVSLVMFDDGGVVSAFRGTSTLVVTSSRLLGVCPRGDSVEGPLDPAAGRVAAWTILLDQIDWVQAEGSPAGGHLMIRGRDAERPWALLAKVREATDGAFRPAPLADLAEVVNRAKSPSA